MRAFNLILYVTIVSIVTIFFMFYFVFHEVEQPNLDNVIESSHIEQDKNATFNNDTNFLSEVQEEVDAFLDDNNAIIQNKQPHTISSARQKKKRGRMKGGRRKRNPFSGIIAKPCSTYKFGQSTFEGCENMHLPLTPRDKKCLPRFVLIPSFPTSGNSLARSLFTSVTGSITTRLLPNARVTPYLGKVYRLGNQGTGWNLYAHQDEVCVDGGKIPTKNQVALIKTHYPVNHLKAYEEVHDLFQSPDDIEEVTHLIRLVRNPGDHVVRNIIKYKLKGRKPWTNECCDVVFDKISSWIDFHTFWSSYRGNVPKMILNYERISNTTTASGVIRELLSFVDERESEEGTLEEKVQEIVREPTFEEGAILAEFCGIETAKKVHELTEHLTEEMGYYFDEIMGVWSLNETNVTNQSVP